MNHKKIHGRMYSELLKIRQTINSINSCQDSQNKEIIQVSDEINNINKRLVEEVFEREKVEQELNLSRDLFFKIFHCSPLLMSITTLDAFRYLDVNEAFLDVAGYSREEVVSRTVSDLNIIESKELEHFQKLVNQGTNRALELSIRTKSGDLRPVVVATECINFNNVTCILWEMRDITEMKCLQEEMVRLGELNLVGEMAASIGHEIRNPMTTARGFLQMLGSKSECLPYKEYFDLIIEELDRANTIVSEFLSVAKTKRNNLKSQNLNKIIETLLPLIQADALIRDNSVNARLEDIPDLPLMEKEIRQLILNLTRNGLESMTSGGTIEIRTYTKGQEVILSVQDQGTGIKPEIVDKLGTPFLTTKEYGTGLGLPVCYSIASRHNAAIDFNTGPGGTTFFVRFRVI